jgi:RNA polymerase sigma-70 factor (ECF subfamily)
MPTTSLTLLDRLRHPDQADAWDRFARLYAPLFMRWAQLQGLSATDAEDLTQTVLIKLVRLLPGYERRDGGTFRGWLFAVCRNECRDFRTRRATSPLPGSDGLAAVAAPPPAAAPDEADDRRLLVHRALELIRGDFSPPTWAAFTRFVLDGVAAADVARGLGLTPNAVYLARNRVLTRLRAELAGLVD